MKKQYLTLMKTIYLQLWRMTGALQRKIGVKVIAYNLELDKCE